MPIARTLNQDFFKTWSPEMAYVLGYFAADGTMVEHARGGWYIEITTTDKELLQIVKNATGSNNTIGVRPKRSQNWKEQYRIQIGSKIWFTDLQKLGFSPKKSLTLSLPKVPKEYFGDFVRGYFDGDGCVYFNKLQYADRMNKRWILMTLFTSGSRPFLEGLHSLLRARGIKGGSIKTKKRGFELAFSHRDSLALYQIMYNTGHISQPHLPRKREKLEKAIAVLGLT